MNALTHSQKDFFWNNGYLVVENAVEPELLNSLQSQFNNWVDESRHQQKAYGQTIDGRARFDLESDHCEQKPALRRVNAPVEISQAYFEAMSNSRMTECVVDLIGPNVKFHHSKINSKLPGSHTAVKWHQDFPFTPHSNDDLITALLMIDDVDEKNGPLQVLPASHQSELHNLWHQGVFTGAIDDETAEDCIANSRICTGKAGSVCLMHTRLLHGSTANHSGHPRTLFICVYAAEDAVAYCDNPMPSKYEGFLVSGVKTNTVRTIAYEIKLPEKPTTASFFDQQEKQV